MTPYRTTAFVSVSKRRPSLVERVLRRLTFFRWARRLLGGHWERQWDFPGPHSSDDGDWYPWEQRACTHGSWCNVTVPCDVHGECEDWDVHGECEDW